MSKNDEQWTEVSIENTATWDRKSPIEGKLVSVKSNVGANESKLYTIQTKDGDFAVWGSTVLDTKFQGIENGSMVKIEPLGEVKSEKSGRTYQDFKVFFKPPAYEEIELSEKDNPFNPEDLPL